MSGYVDYVVDAAHHPVVAVFIFAGAVAGEVHAGNVGPVLLHEAVRIVVDGARHRGPGLAQHQQSAGAFRHRLACAGYHIGKDSGQRECC